jgi:NAD-dependent deacetylase
MKESDIVKAARLISQSKRICAFTGAGISAESGIPPFRGEGGLWNKYDPVILEIGYFITHPAESWEAVRTIFYDFFHQVKPNPAHDVLARWEASGILSAVITQNIDSLHTQAGSKKVYEFHGNSDRLVCIDCHKNFKSNTISLETLPPLCPVCYGILKPDFVFFGEGIPPAAYQHSTHVALDCDLMMIIGTSGEVAPANHIPHIAKRSGALIIEINREPSQYTGTITDLYLEGKAGELLPLIDELINSNYYT